MREILAANNCNPHSCSSRKARTIREWASRDSPMSCHLQSALYSGRSGTGYVVRGLLLTLLGSDLLGCGGAESPVSNTGGTLSVASGGAISLGGASNVASGGSLPMREATHRRAAMLRAVTQSRAGPSALRAVARWRSAVPTPGVPRQQAVRHSRGVPAQPGTRRLLAASRNPGVRAPRAGRKQRAGSPQREAAMPRAAMREPEDRRARTSAVALRRSPYQAVTPS